MATILHIDSSGRHEASYSRKLGMELVERLKTKHHVSNVIARDVAKGVEFVDEDWINANFTPVENRNDAQKSRLKNSDTLVDELIQADHIVITSPMYNFSVPATLKAWIDQVCRAGVTFKYEPTGPVGLLEGKKAYLVIASGGTEILGEMDYITNYLKQIMNFVGIGDVTIIAADRVMADGEAAMTTAQQAIKEAA